MSNRIVKDFKDWNLITEGSDIVGAVNAPLTNVGGGASGSGLLPTAAAAAKAAAVIAAKKKLGGVKAAVPVGAKPPSTVLPATPAQIDKISGDIADMIVKLFEPGNDFWNGENKYEIDAKNNWASPDPVESAVRLFNKYWTDEIIPQLNMLPVDNKNRKSLTAIQTQIEDAILNRSKTFMFQIFINNTAKSYTINPDY